jgi:hypothetical protein
LNIRSCFFYVAALYLEKRCRQKSGELLNHAHYVIFFDHFDPTYTGDIMGIIIVKGKANCGVKQWLQNGLDAAGVVRYYACQ